MCKPEGKNSLHEILKNEKCIGNSGYMLQCKIQRRDVNC